MTTQENLEQKVKILLTFCDKVNEVVRRDFNGFTVNRDNQPALFCTALFMRVIENYDGIVLMNRNEMPINSFIVVRSMFEAYLILAKASADSNFRDVYYNKFVREKVEHLEKIQKCMKEGRPIGFTLAKEEIDAIVSDFQKHKIDEITDKYGVYHLSKDLNHTDLYLSTYVYCNSFTHCDFASLHRYFDTKGPLELVFNNQTDKDIVLSTFMAIRIFLLSYEVYCIFFGREKSAAIALIEEHNQIENEFRKMLIR